MPAIHPIQDSPLVVEPEKYTCHELQAALAALMNLVMAQSHDERKRICAMLPTRVLDLTIKCLEDWEAATRPTIH